MGLALGGAGGGYDSAAMVKATSTSDMLGPVVQKRLEIRIIFDAFRRKW